jgi:hypothetical protein
MTDQFGPEYSTKAVLRQRGLLPSSTYNKNPSGISYTSSDTPWAGEMSRFSYQDL